MRRFELSGPIPTALGLGSLGAGTFLVAFANHGEIFGVPSAWLEWPSLPGALGTFLAGLGVALLLLLGITGNLLASHRRATWTAGALLVAAIGLELVPAYARIDRGGVASGLLVAASLAALVWPGRRTRYAGLAAAFLLAALAVAIGFSARGITPRFEAALFPVAGMLAGLAIVAGAAGLRAVRPL